MRLVYLSKLLSIVSWMVYNVQANIFIWETMLEGCLASTISTCNGDKLYKKILIFL